MIIHDHNQVYEGDDDDDDEDDKQGVVQVESSMAL